MRARTDGALWAVSRPSFVAAVGAVADARALAEDVAAQHLTRPRVS